MASTIDTLEQTNVSAETQTSRTLSFNPLSRLSNALPNSMPSLTNMVNTVADVAMKGAVVTAATYSCYSAFTSLWGVMNQDPENLNTTPDDALIPYLSALADAGTVLMTGIVSKSVLPSALALLSLYGTKAYGASTWSQINTEDSPNPREGHSAVSIGSNLYVFGGALDPAVDGLTSTFSNELWRYNSVSTSWKYISPKGIPPKARVFSCSAAMGDSMYIFGGIDNCKDFNDLWRYNSQNNTWQQLVPNPQSEIPPVRYGCALSSIGSSLYLFGGAISHSSTDSNPHPKNDLWRYDLITNTWLNMNSKDSAPVRFFHTLSSPCGTKLYLFGGIDENSDKNDLWTYDVSNNQWQKVNANGTPPPSRYGHSAIVTGNKIRIFGGNQGPVLGNLNDIWDYDTQTNKWTQVNPAGKLPNLLVWHSANNINDTMYIFAGVDSQGKNNYDDLLALTNN